MKKSSLNKQKMKRTVCEVVSRLPSTNIHNYRSYRVGIIQVQYLASALIDLLVTLSAHAQRRIHVHIVTRQIQRDQSLENDAPSRERACQEDNQTRGCTAVRHHVEHSSELGGLFKFARSHAVEGIEEAGDAVRGGACAGVERHVVEGGDGEDDTTITWRICQSDVKR